ncbi:hypothetical protein [Streptomyces chartreusis]|uniref:hypothetical protein n=1 Tax=Streptomyces chartreusis TaxID=1969 RepID=UPI002E824B4F|nr:hypothetical protein [Streptomyces chartreusis]WUB21318.1 hypothetical protein OG997_33375 [Streptomyces chartreusis]
MHWADSLVTSNEASRITQDMVGHFRRSARPAFRFVIEREADRQWVFLPSRNELVLRPPTDSQAEEAQSAERLTAHPALWALAASELRATPLAVWSELCRILEIQASVEDLSALAEHLTDLLIESSDGTGQVTVAFRMESLRHRLRRLRPVDHGAIVSELVGVNEQRNAGAWGTGGSVGSYTPRALGLHAVHAGLLD